MSTRGDRGGAPSGPGEHPELEELAALIDGRLSTGRAARVRAHLASCEECREVFFETVDFVRDEEAREGGSTIAALERLGRTAALKSRLAIALPAAAVLALSVGLVYTQLIAPPKVAWPQLAHDLAHQQTRLKGDAFHVQILRGNRNPEGEISKQSFRLGVALVNLQVSLEGENPQQADNALAKINEINADLRPAADVKSFYRRLRNPLSSHLQPWAERAEKMADRFRSSANGPADDLYLDFGMWAEAGHLAAAAEDERFLTSRDNRRFPDYLRQQLKKDGDKLPAEVETAVQAIEGMLDHDHLGAEEYHRLAEQYERIMRFYDREAEADQ